MKKIVYIVVVLLILLGIASLLKNNAQPQAPVEEVVVETEMPAPAVEEEVVVVDVEPTAEEVEIADTVEAADVEEAVEVVEENPEETADEGETFVEE